MTGLESFTNQIILPLLFLSSTHFLSLSLSVFIFFLPNVLMRWKWVKSIIFHSSSHLLSKRSSFFLTHLSFLPILSFRYPLTEKTTSNNNGSSSFSFIRNFSILIILFISIPHLLILSLYLSLSLISSPPPLSFFPLILWIYLIETNRSISDLNMKPLEAIFLSSHT